MCASRPRRYSTSMKRKTTSKPEPTNITVKSVDASSLPRVAARPLAGIAFGVVVLTSLSALAAPRTFARCQAQESRREGARPRRLQGVRTGHTQRGEEPRAVDRCVEHVDALEPHAQRCEWAWRRLVPEIRIGDGTVGGPPGGNALVPLGLSGLVYTRRAFPGFNPRVETSPGPQQHQIVCVRDRIPGSFELSVRSV